MACGNNGGQQSQQMSQQSMPQQASSMPSYQPDSQTGQMIANYQAMKNSGIFQTPYQKAMQQHPIAMGLANAAQAFGQGLTKQPYYTENQANQASLENTQDQGINAINTLPAQMRMMMMYQNGLAGAQPSAPTNIPGVAPMTPVIPTPNQAPANPLAVQMAAAKAAGYSDAEVQAYLARKK